MTTDEIRNLLLPGEKLREFHVELDRLTTISVEIGLSTYAAGMYIETPADRISVQGGTEEEAEARLRAYLERRHAE